MRLQAALLLQAKASDQPLQQIDGGLQAVQGEKLVRLVRLIDIPGPQNQCLHTELVEIWPLGGEGDSTGALPGQLFAGPDDRRISGGLEGRHAGKQRLIVDLYLVFGGDRQKPFADRRAQFVAVHAG